MRKHSLERGPQFEQQTNREDEGLLASDVALGELQIQNQEQQTLAQTIKILDNNINNKDAQNVNGGRVNQEEFNEYKDISGANRDYLDITDIHHGDINMARIGGRNQIKIKVNKDRGILDDLSYFSQDLEELSQNNNMSLKFYDFNGFKSSLSHRGANSSSYKGAVRPEETMRGSRRIRHPKVADHHMPGLVLATSASPSDNAALHKKDSPKTTEGRSKSEVNVAKAPGKFRTVRPPDSQQMLQRAQKVRQSNQCFEHICLKNETPLMATDSAKKDATEA